MLYEDFLDARLNVSEIEGLEPSPPPARGSRDGGRGRRDGGRGGRGGFGGGRRFEGESNFKRREGGDDRPRRAMMTNLVVTSIIRWRRSSTSRIQQSIVHVVKAVSKIVHVANLTTIVRRREGGFEDRPRREFNNDRPRREGGFEDRPRREFNSDRPAS